MLSLSSTVSRTDLFHHVESHFDLQPVPQSSWDQPFSLPQNTADTLLISLRCTHTHVHIQTHAHTHTNLTTIVIRFFGCCLCEQDIVCIPSHGFHLYYCCDTCTCISSFIMLCIPEFIQGNIQQCKLWCWPVCVHLRVCVSAYVCVCVLACVCVGVCVSALAGPGREQPGAGLRGGGVRECGAGGGGAAGDGPHHAGRPGDPPVTLHAWRVRTQHPGRAHRRPGSGESHWGAVGSHTGVHCDAQRAPSHWEPLRHSVVRRRRVQARWDCSYIWTLMVMTSFLVFI